MQLKEICEKWKIKALEELPKQDRKQQVQESARKQEGKKASGQAAWQCFTWVASSATLTQI